MDRLTKAQMEFMNGYVPANIDDIYQDGGTATGQGDEMTQLIQMYAQYVAQQSGEDPNQVYQQLMQQLQELEPQELQQAVEQIASELQTVQQQMQEQQQAPSQEQMQEQIIEEPMQEEIMAYGGPFRADRSLVPSTGFNNALVNTNMAASPYSSMYALSTMNNKPAKFLAGITGAAAGLAGSALGYSALFNNRENADGYQKWFNNRNNQAQNINPNLNLKVNTPSFNTKQDPFKVSNYANWKPDMQVGGANTAAPIVNDSIVPAVQLTPAQQRAAEYQRLRAAQKAKNAIRLAPIEADQEKRIQNFIINNPGSTRDDYFKFTKYQNNVGVPGVGSTSKETVSGCAVNAPARAYGGELPHAQYGKANTGKKSIITPEQRKLLADIQSGKSKEYSAKNDRASMITGNAKKQDATSVSSEKRKGALVRQSDKEIYKMNNPNVVVFAESPKTALKYNMYDSSINIPELKMLQQQMDDVEAKRLKAYTDDPTYRNLKNKTDKALEIISSRNYIDENSAEYKNYVSLSDALYEYTGSEKFKKSNSEYQKQYDKLVEKFSDPKINPRVMDSTFYKEAQNVKKFYNRTNPNVNVDVVPMYGNPKLMEDKLKNLTPYDKVAVFGHSGDKLAGIPNDDIADYLSKSKAKNCYFGSCFFEDNVERSNLKKLKGKTLHYRPSSLENGDTAWYGFNPDASSFDEGMWSRNYVKGQGVNVTPIKQRTTHITKKLEYGGNLPQAQFGIPGDFDFNNPRQPSYSTPGFVQGMGVGQDGYGGADNSMYNYDPNAQTANDKNLYNAQQALGVTGQNYEFITDAQVANENNEYAFPKYAPNNNRNSINTNKKVLNNVSGQQIANNALFGFKALSNSLTNNDVSNPTYNTMDNPFVNNPLNAYGNYTTNVQAGADFFQPNKHVAAQDYGSTRVAKYGGQQNFASGGQYKVSHDELLQLLRDGAEIEFL